MTEKNSAAEEWVARFDTLGLLDDRKRLEEVDLGELYPSIREGLAEGGQITLDDMLGAYAAWLHQGGPDFEGGMSWEDVAARISEEFGTEVEKWKARDAARWFLKTQNWERWGVERGSAGVEAKIEGNEIIVTGTKLDRILSPEELIERAGMDSDDWVITRQEMKKYEAPRKHTIKDLSWESGRMTGTLTDDGEMVVAEMFTITVYGIKREPDPIYPVIQPVTYSGEILRPEPPEPRPFVRHLVWGDAQMGFRRQVHDAKLIPFHDRRCLDLIAQIAAAAKPDKMHVTGDMFDCTEWTDKFLRSPEFYFTFQPALYEGHWWLTQYVQLAGEVLMHQGNHEVRLPDAVKRHLPFAYGLRPAHASVIHAPQILSFRFLLDMDELGITWIDDYPNDLYWLAKQLALYHGNTTRKNPLDVAKALAKHTFSIINLHNHKNEAATENRKNADGEYTVWGYSCPCACHIDYRVPGHKHNQYWSQGLIIVDVFDNKHFNIQPVPIENGRAIWNGQIFRARGRVTELRKALPDWNW